MSVSLETEAADLAPEVNVDAAQTYGGLLRDLAKAAGTDAPTLADVLRFSDVLRQPTADDSDDGEVWRVAEVALATACDRLAQDACPRGTSVGRRYVYPPRRTQPHDGSGRSSCSRTRRRSACATIAERLAEIMGGERVDSARLEVEIALLADRLDVTEECVRLRAHLRFFKEAMASDEASGRRLNFLAQEIGREVNTVGSKANDVQVAHLAVGMKEELEKIREQVQNVE